jgi:hypothetical protein
MWSRDSTYVVEGTVTLRDSSGRVSVIAVSRDGSGEPIDVPVDSLSLHGDSLAFGFAPIGFRLQGRCTAEGVAAGRFSVPQPPFEPITGVWVLRRRTK